MAVKHKWLLKKVNEVASFKMECDSAAAIEGAMLTPIERKAIQEKCQSLIDYIKFIVR